MPRHPSVLDSFKIFDSFETALNTICEIEIMHMIRKEQVEEIQSALAEVEFTNKIMGISGYTFTKNSLSTLYASDHFR